LFDAETQRRLTLTPGVAGIAFSKSLAVTLDPALPPASLIVRPVKGPGYSLPVIQQAARPADGVALWLSEPAARLYNAQPGDAFTLPIGSGGAKVTGYVAGIWRDYARQQGAIVIDTRDYTAITGDAVRSEAAVELTPGASVADTRAAILERLPPETADAWISPNPPRCARARFGYSTGASQSPMPWRGSPF
jgi:putative ABC transport system permease protein